MKIAAYVITDQVKGAYKVESYDIRRNAGLEMVCDALKRGGYEVGYCGKDTAHKQDIVLVSITAACDWYAYIRERQKWHGKPGMVIVGGAGCLNVLPVMQWFDCAVFGRGEDIIVPLVKAGRGYDHPSVCWSDNMRDEYYIQQANGIYPHPIRLADTTMAQDNEQGYYKETGIGCNRRCLFCAFGHHREHVKGGADPYEGGGNKEVTIAGLDLENPEQWENARNWRNFGLDGVSDKLRIMVRKGVTRYMLYEFFQGLDKVSTPRQLKAYCIVGYPTEGPDDYDEHMEDLREIDGLLRPGDKQWSWLMATTPFRAMPATPAAIWPMSIRDYRTNGLIRHIPGKGRVYYQGKRLWAVEYMGTDSLSSVALDALMLRGDQRDADLVSRLCATPKYWTANSKDKITTLGKSGDVDRWFAEYTWDTLPTKYLKSYWMK
jgi:hypothetical protein